MIQVIYIFIYYKDSVCINAAALFFPRESVGLIRYGAMLN